MPYPEDPEDDFIATEPGELDAAVESWHVYFLSLVDPSNPGRDFELLKVGITKNDVERRIAQLQTGNPYQIRCEASFPTLVARQVENWVHRTNAARVAQLEWLRVCRCEIPDLVSAARLEADRFAQMAEARARWSQSSSNKRERTASLDERRLHEAIRDVLSQSWPVKLRLRHVMASIALDAGRVLRVPGIVRVRLVPSSPRFSSQIALQRFPDLTAGHTIETVSGKFRWRQVPHVGSSGWTKLRVEVERLESQQRELDRAMLDEPDSLRDEAERTDNLASLHQEYLLLKQQEARLQVDEAGLQAQVIRQLEDFEAIADVCSFPRSPRLVLNHHSFCKDHGREAAECSFERVAYVRRDVYASRSY